MENVKTSSKSVEQHLQTLHDVRANNDVILDDSEGACVNIKRKITSEICDRDAEEFITTIIETEYGVIRRRNNKRQKIEIFKIIDKKTENEKPPIPPKPKHLTDKMTNNGSNKLRTKFDQVHGTAVQKLTVQNDQLRIENNTLRSALVTEHNVVRNLR